MIENILKWLEIAGVKQKGTDEQFDLCCDLILEELNELTEAYNKNDIKEQEDAIADLIWVSLNWAYMKKLDILSTLKKVEISNYSKFCKTEECAIKTVEEYKNGTHWDKQGIKVDAYYQKVNDLYVIKRTEDNKILKSIEYTPVSKVKI